MIFTPRNFASFATVGFLFLRSRRVRPLKANNNSGNIQLSRMYKDFEKRNVRVLVIAPDKDSKQERLIKDMPFFSRIRLRFRSRRADETGVLCKAQICWVWKQKIIRKPSSTKCYEIYCTFCDLWMSFDGTLRGDSLSGHWTKSSRCTLPSTHFKSWVETVWNVLRIGPRAKTFYCWWGHR